jgi:hypothetical protein
MLLNLNKKSWIDGLRLQNYNDHCKLNETTIKTMLDLANNYNKALEEEEKMTPEQLAIKNVGKQVNFNYDSKDLSNYFYIKNKINRIQNDIWKRMLIF